MFHFMGNKSIFDSDCEALVNPVNCLGQSGKGLALQFAQRYTQQQRIFEEHAKSGRFRPNDVLLVEGRPKTVIYFPTKDDWRNPSQLSWIERGLDDLVWKCLTYEIRSVAIPRLGCGLGELKWEQVEPLILGIVGMGHFDRVDIYSEPTANTLERMTYDTQN